MSTLTTQGLEVLYSRQQIADRVAEMGAQISRDLNGEKLVMVGVLKGAAFFLVDLSRAIQADATFDFVAVSSYGKGQRSSGAVKVIKDLDQPIEGKNVLMVEDISIPASPSPICASFSCSSIPNLCASPRCSTSLRAASRKLTPIMWASPFPTSLSSVMEWTTRSVIAICPIYASWRRARPVSSLASRSNARSPSPSFSPAPESSSNSPGSPSIHLARTRRRRILISRRPPMNLARAVSVKR